jgi:hypothetical protein
MGSSRKQGSKILGVIDRREAEGLLVEWANLRDDDSRACLKLLARYRDVFKETLPITSLALLSYRETLRKAWDAPDRRRRDWYTFQLRHAFEFSKRLKAAGEDVEQLWREGNRERLMELMEPPSITPLEAVAFYFQTYIAERAKHCGGPDCLAPYFIAVKRWQKYCSEKCAGPATREAKRKWWNDNRAKNGGFE